MPALLIVNADDFNLTEGVSRGIVEAHRNGIVTSTTVMVNLPGLEGSRCLAQGVPRLGVGLHLNVTYGPPVSPPERVPSLVGGNGRFIRDAERLARDADLSEVRAECLAQARRFEASFGRPPTHLDSHHHVHRHPRIFEVVVDLAVHLGVPVRVLSPAMRQESRRRSLPAADSAFGGVGPRAFWDSQRLVACIGALAPGVTELMCHPGFVDAPLTASGYCEQRQAELRALCDPCVRSALATAGVGCITYRDLRADNPESRCAPPIRPQ